MTLTLEIKQTAFVGLLAAAVYLHPAAVLAAQGVVCPPSTSEIEGAEPIFGSLQEPWGEFRDAESIPSEDGTDILRFHFTGPISRGADKWLICYYKDGNYEPVKLPRTTAECTVVKKPGRIDPATKRQHYKLLRVICK